MNTCRILMLIAEKDRVVEEAASYFSNTRGCEVLFIQNGLEAVDIVKESPPDIIIMDLLLPKLDGIRVCKILKENEITSNIPIVVLSIISAERRSLEAGADIFLLKPVKSTDLIDAVENILLNQYFDKVEETVM